MRLLLGMLTAGRIGSLALFAPVTYLLSFTHVQLITMEAQASDIR